MPFDFIETDIPGVILVRPKIFNDARGLFAETYKYSDFLKAGITENFVQDNISRSRKGTLRGLHYQLNPAAQAKLVRCSKGRIFDVAVDIRRGSPYYGRWVGVEMSEEENSMLYIPRGFAHGFVALSDNAEVIYKCSSEYSPAHDRGIIWNDPDIGITWPISEPILSEKDMQHPNLRDADNNFTYK